MPQTILLSRTLGLFLLIVGVLVVIRRHYFIPVFATFARERLLRVVLSLLELLAGLFLVATHNDWSSLPAGIISAVGWILIAEGIAYAALPDEWIERLLTTFNTPAWYVGGGVLAVAAGVYLAGHGFGMGFGMGFGAGAQG